ncbi:MAG: rhomboid family intramembrane serine protease [Alphaproteobacteria bacterium]|nr:rhomboid family intramembrane serine protease [Alphaproteobacteria bacterium]
MRQRDGAVLCSSCHRLIHVSEKRCPHCGAAAPSLFGYGPALRRVFGPNADIVGLIIFVCVLLYAASVGVDLPGMVESSSFGLFDLVSPSMRALTLFGMTGGWAWAQGHWWTLLTASFLHGSLLHIAFNMMWARQLGSDAVEVFGPARFFVLWSLSGAGGFLLSNVLGGAPTIGASASVFGLMGGLAAFGRRRGGGIGAQISRQMWTWAIAMGIFGALMPAVNNLGHAGGFLSGFLLGYLLPLQGRARETRVVQVLALVLAVGTAAGVVASIALNIGPLFLQR